MNVKGTSKIYCLYCKEFLSELKEMKLGYHLSCFHSFPTNKLLHEIQEKVEQLAQVLRIPESTIAKFILNENIKYKINEKGKIFELELIKTDLKSFTLTASCSEDLQSLAITNEPIWDPHYWDYGVGDWKEIGLTEFPANISELNKLRMLNLSGNNITIIPEIITNLTSLEILNLNYNAIKSFPENIDRLTNLKKLFLNYEKGIIIPPELNFPTNFSQLHQLEELKINACHMEHLPESFTNLKKLTTLVITGKDLHGYRFTDFTGHFLTYLPDNFGSLSNLQYIDFSCNNLTYLPESFKNLKNLETLNLSNQMPYSQKNSQKKFNTFPDVLCELKSLKNLYLSLNFMKKLPDSFGNLTNLTTLDMADNKLNFLPESLGYLKSLRILSLTHNHLKYLPETIGNLTNLRVLDLSANRQLTSIPDSINEIIGLQEMYLQGTGIVNLPSEIIELPNLTLGLTKKQRERFSNFTEDFPNNKFIVFPNQFKWEEFHEKRKFL